VDRNPQFQAASLVLAALAVSPAAFAVGIAALGSDVYYRAVQEDGLLEWASFFGFALAAVVFGARGLEAQRGQGLARSWWPLGLAAFCALVAMEEISWGQRLLGFRPPDYFLESNFQQELNLHNVVPTDLRKLGLLVVILGYGVALPLAAWVPLLRGALGRLGIASPGLPLAFAFAASGALYAVYPWRFTGEWVECMVGLAFLGSALCLPRSGSTPDVRSRWLRPVAWGAATLVLSGAAVAFTQSAAGRDPGRVEAVRRELSLLRADFRGLAIDTPCGAHRRLFTLVETEGWGRLRQGRFAGLIDAGLPESRAEYFLDPWNSPYWVRDRCGPERRRWIYSLGPNRRRDSTPDAILGDDEAVQWR
jgi:hypothetical protein